MVLKKSHNNVSHPHLRIIAKLLTDELLVAKDIPNPSNDISENILTDTSMY